MGRKMSRGDTERKKVVKMCGIGFFVKENETYAKSKLIPRGIRTKTVEIESGVLIGRRLPIQGISEAYDSPFIHRGKAFLFSGEIYNYKQINPKADSDIEVVADKLSQSESCFEEFDGMWSVIVYDRLQDKLVAYTDFLAKKPLYYTLNPFQISSEIKTLFNHQTINTKVLSHVLKWGYHWGDNQTPFCGIYKLRPGSKISYSFDWDEPEVEAVPSMRIEKRKFRESDLYDRLWESVYNRIVSDLPVSVLTSGGVDSSIIATILNNELGEGEIKAFHVLNTGEQPYLSLLEEKYIFKAERILIEESKSSEALMCSDTPYDLGSLLIQYELGKRVRDKGFYVTIAGDGADEIFGGYNRMNFWDTQESDVWDELVYYHLPRLDCMMMQNTVELRSPYLSKEVLELGLSLPYKERINKKALREVFQDCLPKEIAEREKTAMRVKMPSDRKEFYGERIHKWLLGVTKWRNV